ncbi:hypothetical protein BDP67DRAFT_530346 [Colletotrichum lupini]|nr:hypothetical protein BDP67DRAFT_530346 [Colletotrichum lupini]
MACASRLVLARRAFCGCPAGSCLSSPCTVHTSRERGFLPCLLAYLRFSQALAGTTVSTYRMRDSPLTTSVKLRCLHVGRDWPNWPRPGFPPSRCDIAIKRLSTLAPPPPPHLLSTCQHRNPSTSCSNTSRKPFLFTRPHPFSHIPKMSNVLPKTDAPKVGVNDAIAALPAYKSLSSFLKTEGATDKQALENTVDEFKDLAKKSESQIEDFLWDTYNAIFAVAKQTPPEKQTPLLDFLQRLRETTVTASDGQPLKLNNQVVWKDLPTFGWVARDLWNFGEYIHHLQ